MAFAEKFDTILKDRGVSKSALARKLGIPQSTFFNGRSKDLGSWKVPEWNQMVEQLRLTSEEVTFLTSDVE